MRVDRYEKSAVVNEFTNELLDVFLEYSKIHDKYVFKGFVITPAKIAKNLQSHHLISLPHNPLTLSSLHLMPAPQSTQA